LQEPPKCTQIWIFGLKTNRLATLLKSFMKFAAGNASASAGVQWTKMHFTG
jgi:hypothetical protein